MAIEDKDTTDLSVAPIVGPDDPRRFTDSGIEIKPLYTASDMPEDLDLGEPGEFPFTRGIHREMYRKRRWTMRQYAGYASARESNERYKYLLKNGSTGLSMAFDLPTQLGLDSDDPRCLGEVGRTGVAIDTLEDMRMAFDGIPLDEVSTSMTINAPASVLLLLYELVAEEQGVPSEKLTGTVQNDILKEYIARGNFIYPPEPSMRLVTDLFAYCKDNVPKWNTVSISGYHFREKGCSAVQEVAFTLANGMAYVQAALDAGLAVDDFAPRLAFFFNGHNNVFQEVAKFRAARNMWAHAMRDRFGSEDPKSQTIRFHTQTGGVTLTAQQPINNIVRVALQGFAAVCGGTQSLHTNGYDEALALPSERAAKIALRTQQILAHESGAADTVDPFAGSYYVEALTADIERRAWALIEKIDEMGGSVEAIAFIKGEIEESAFGYHERYRTGQDIVVGVNKYEEDDIEVEEILRVDPETERDQLERLKKFKSERDQELAGKRLEELKGAAEGTGNLLPYIKQALKDHCSIGEVCGAMREHFGEYRPEH
jgi:methylmalonyl-CoA mutase N-terminal domain/subunit